MPFPPPWKKTNYTAEQIRKAKERQSKAALRKKAREDAKAGKHSTIWQESARRNLRIVREKARPRP